MGVTVLQQFPMTENRTGPQTIEFLTKRIVALGAVQTGQFLVDCETYMSVPQLGVQRTVHVLHNSEQPASVFAVLESGSKVVPLIADGLFDLLMLKMTTIYTSKKQTKIESKGPRFEIGDFCVKFGSVTMSQNFKGVLVEVEYRPCVVPGSAWELMREFLQGFLGSAVPNQAPQYLQLSGNQSGNQSTGAAAYRDRRDITPELVNSWKEFPFADRDSRTRGQRFKTLESQLQLQPQECGESKKKRQRIDDETEDEIVTTECYLNGTSTSNTRTVK